ncbi:acetolactate synthase 2 small subunit [Salinivibrio socompensis]|uniref:acetolactate synthase 2 small subunit n=1 Tax=Salinivibrio socompensis TaxID=1510206 RepID=UPI000471F0B1|nr:acetolactate synthase 2 small subunit [Salinivibrio socompensis]
MTQHQFSIHATHSPELLERVLRVIRHRGFTVCQFTMSMPSDSGQVIFDVTVESQRAIETLRPQLTKLWDVAEVMMTSSTTQSLRA